MPTNKELTDDILAIDPNAEVEGLTNTKLSALLKDLRAKTPEPQGLGLQLGAPLEDSEAPEPEPGPEPEPEPGPGPEPEPEPGPEPEPEPEPLAKVLIVAEGRAITSKRGVLGPGDEVRAEYFAGGEDTIQSLKKQGMIK